MELHSVTRTEIMNLCVHMPIVGGGKAFLFHNVDVSCRLCDVKTFATFLKSDLVLPRHFEASASHVSRRVLPLCVVDDQQYNAL